MEKENLKNKEIIKENESINVNNRELIKQNAKDATKISVTTIIVNILLATFKLFAGIFGFSYAMISDAVHSFSDVFTTIIVIIGVRISAKQADKQHPYGHDRFECVAALILSFILFDVGLIIGYSAIEKLITGSYLTAEVPKVIALVAAFVSTLTQFILFVLTKRVAKKINSGALKADAWHHLSDSLSSIGSLIGIGGAMLGFPILDVIAGLVICLLIIKVAIEVFIESTKKMTDNSASEETEEKIREIANSVEGVKSIDELRTRKFGNMIYIDLEISCDANLKLFDAHEIAQIVHDKMEKELKFVKHCSIHVNPYIDKI